MTWTYDVSQLSTSQLMQVRYLIGDTLQKDPQVQDEEINFVLSQRASIYGAAADACRNLAAQLSRQADSTQGNLHTLYSSRARAYAARAAQLEAMAASRSGALPYSGQTSRADYDNVVNDADRLGPQFSIGLDENRLPVGPVAPEHSA